MTQATIDDLTVKRNADGRLLPEEGKLKDITDSEGNEKTAEVIPMVYGDVMEYFGSAGSVEDIDSDIIAQILDEHVVSPDLTEHPSVGDTITGDFVDKQLPPLVPRSLLMLIFEVSGMDADVEMQDDGGATVDFEEGNGS